MPLDPSTFSQLSLLARTIWGEARSEGQHGMEAVAAVIMNRVRHPHRWGNSVAEVCLQPRQFSCWNADDPNRKKLFLVSHAQPSFRLAWEIADRAIHDELEDPTGGADHYHEESVNPSWARGQTPIVRIGQHVFYKLAE